MVRATLLLSLLFATTASALDPECVDTTTDPTTIDVTDGSFQYCTPVTDDSNPAISYPLTGYPMTCEAKSGGRVIHTAADIGPGIMVTVPSGSERFENDVTIQCSNSAPGAGEVFGPIPGRFPAAAPGRPSLVSVE